MVSSNAFKLTPFHINEYWLCSSQNAIFQEQSDVSQKVRDILLYQVVNENFEQKQKDFYEAQMNGEHGMKQSIHEQYLLQTMAK
eukprot:9875934-Ditylum_brightwellii.AAC.1